MAADKVGKPEVFEQALRKLLQVVPDTRKQTMPWATAFSNVIYISRKDEAGRKSLSN